MIAASLETRNIAPIIVHRIEVGKSSAVKMYKIECVPELPIITKIKLTILIQCSGGAKAKIKQDNPDK